MLRHLALPLRFLAAAMLAALPALPARAAVPAADHVVVVVMENKSFAEVRSQPYVASLMSAGAWFAGATAITHPSQPNYIALWSGSTQGVTNDVCPAPGSPFATAKDIVSYGEREYARFCRRFSAAATAEVLKQNPAETVILINDISEGPDFHRLQQAGFPIATIYHVDVVAYVADMYARRMLKPETMVRWYDRIEASPLRPLIPSISKLVFEQQRATVRHSQAIIVPSSGMKEVLLRCYPWCPSGRIKVLPWGA